MTVTTPEWVKDAIFYQIFPDRFAQSQRVPKQGLNLEPWGTSPTPYGFKGGDLLGVVEHLDYLKDLGITAIYFNPIFASAANHRYHTYDYYNVDPLLGGNSALQELIDEAHKRDIRIVLDGVFNHASRGFWQFNHILENGASSPYVDWFHVNPEFLNRRKHLQAYPNPQEYQGWEAGQNSYDELGYLAWWHLPALPKFNTNTPAVRDFIFDVAEHWIKFGIDGWRLDVPGEIDDDAFWQEFRQRVKAINPEAYIVGEIWHESPRWLQGDQFDAVMNYLVTMASLGFFGGENLDIEVTNQAGGYQGRVHLISLDEFANEIDRILGLYDPAVTQVQLNLLDSHDTPRFITSVQGDQSALRLALLFMFTYPGAPCVYYGDEIGLDGGHDPDCRKSFPWDESRWDQDLLRYTKECIALRKANPALRRGDYRRLYARDGIYAFERHLDGETLIVAINASTEARTVTIPAKGLGEGPLSVIFGQTEASVLNGEIKDLKVPARSSVVLKK
jgi:cyclomaltodextrinase